MPDVTSMDLPMQSVSQQQQQQRQDKVTEDLAARIASVRAEIKALTSRRQYLTSALLSSPEVQTAIREYQGQRNQDHSDSIPPIIAQLDRHSRHVELNLHRLTFSVTSFPYTDPSPPPPSSDQDRTGDGKLLGVRIDVPRRGGSYEKPFYVILRKVNAIGENEVYLTVHRHTVPAFVPLRELEKRYLPLPSALPELENSHNAAVEQEVPLKPSKQPRQDLHSFICMIRNALVSWRLRVDAVELLQQRLSSSPYQNIMSIEATSLEHRYLRLDWRDGRVGRIKVGEQGEIERAIVIGEQGIRDKLAENAIIRGKYGRIDELLSRLREI